MAAPRDNAPNAGQIRGLGLLEASAKEVDVRKPGTLPTLSDNQPRGKKDMPTLS